MLSTLINIKINVLCQMKIVNYMIIVIACFEPSHALHLAVQNGMK